MTPRSRLEIDDTADWKSALRRKRWKGILTSALCPLISGLFLCLPAPAAELVPRVLEDYTYPNYHDPPNETQIKTLLKGARATPLDPPQSNRTLVTKARLEKFQTNGVSELIVEAAECVSDEILRTVNSSNALRVFTPDGKFYIEGVGFLWIQTNSILFISNKVHTIAELPRNQGPSPSITSTTQPGEKIEIFSDRFRGALDDGLGVYTGRLRVSGTNMLLTGGILTVKFPVRGNGRPSSVEDILVETNVVVDYVHQEANRKETFHVSGATAHYLPATDVVHIKGHPTWRADDRKGTADELTIDRTNKVFTGNGHGWMRMPNQGGGGAAFLSRSGTAASRQPGNHFIEIVADNYQFRTNLANFVGEVEVHDLLGEQVQGMMNCGRMDITFSGTNELQRMVADQRVIIQDGTNRLTGGHAVYTATNGLLVITQKPTWQSGVREGRGDIEQLKLQQSEMTVRGNAYVKMPAQDLSQSDFAGFGRTGRAIPKAQTSEFAEIFSQSYTLSQTNGYFSGGVSIVHPQINWTCTNLAVHWPHEGARVDRMVAERGVRFESTDDKGQKTSATADQAVYTYSVTDGLTNEVLKLTGNPATLIGTNGVTFKNPVITYDMLRKQVIASGSYRIAPPTNAVGSNTLLFPKGTFSK
jgi:lipopolysaccharide export system protein LptA